MPVYDFKEQLAKGQAHERVVADFFRGRGWKVTMTEMDDQRAGRDMWMEISMLPDAISIELKSDELSHKTGNIFLELVSVGKYHDGEYVVKKEGWLWTTRATFLVYHVVGTGDILIFKPETLRDFVAEHEKEYRSVSVKNSGYTGRGLLVPMSDMMPLAVKVLNIGVDN